jgi:DNA-binding transcriptional LysR family regulator
LRRNVVVGTPSYLEAHGTPLTPQDLTGHACLRVRLPNGAIHRWPFEKDGQSVLIDVEGAITLDEASLARTAVLASAGLALAMESDVRDDIEAGRLVRVLEDWTPTLPPLSLYYPSRRNPTAAFKAFVDFTRRQSGASKTLTPSIVPEAPATDIPPP